MTRFQLWLLGWVKGMDAIVRIVSLGWLVSSLEIDVMERMIRRKLAKQISNCTLKGNSHGEKDEA